MLVEASVHWWRHWRDGGDMGGLVEALDYGGDNVAVMGPLQPLATISSIRFD